MTTTLVEQLENAFEKPQKTKKPETLAKYVSDQLMEPMPRLSQELFELKREATICLSDTQIKEITPLFIRAQEDRRYNGLYVAPFSLKSIGYSRNGFEERVLKGIVGKRCSAEVPRFFYIFSGTQEVISLKGIAKIVYDAKWTDTLESSYGEEPYGDYKFVLHEEWTAPFALDVNAKIPQIPEGFIELGDEAVAEYYDRVRKAPAELRKRTQLDPPRIGILWSPRDEDLYCTGKIPQIKPPRPKGDPALILDIPDGDKNYRHVVAVWDIGEERPLRNWLAEYSEGKRR